MWLPDGGNSSWQFLGLISSFTQSPVTFQVFSFCDITIFLFLPEGYDEESRMLRRSLMRWMNLAMILVLRSISSAVKQRFPTLDHVVEAGFMTVNEKKLFESVPANEFNTYWVPCTWFVYRLQEATKHGRLLNQYALENIMRVRQFLVILKMNLTMMGMVGVKKWMVGPIRRRTLIV